MASFSITKKYIKYTTWSVMIPFLQYRGSRTGLFCNLSAGEFYPLRILPRSCRAVELRFPPLISSEKKAPSDSAELVAGHQALSEKASSLYNLMSRGKSPH